MSEIKYAEKKIFDDAETQWLRIIFTVAIFSVFCSFVIPNIIFLIIGFFNFVPGSFLRIVLGTVTVQFFLLIPVILMMWHLYKQDKNDYGLLGYNFFTLLRQKFAIVNWQKKFILDALKMEFIIIIPLFLLAFFAYKLVVYLGYNPLSPITILLSIANIKGVLFIFFMSVFVAPIAEEILFRRIIFSFMQTVTGNISAVLLSSFLFSILHGGIVQILPLTAFGCALQYLYIKHKSLYPCLVLHSLHNCIMMCLFLIAWTR